MSFITLHKAGAVQATTRDAVLIDYEGGREIWIPKSVIENGFEISKGDTDIVVQEWFADKEGLE